MTSLFLGYAFVSCWDSSLSWSRRSDATAFLQQTSLSLLGLCWKSFLAISHTWLRILNRRPKQNLELWTVLTGCPICILNPFTHVGNWNIKAFVVGTESEAPGTACCVMLHFTIITTMLTEILYSITINDFQCIETNNKTRLLTICKKEREQTISYETHQATCAGGLSQHVSSITTHTGKV